ncbi:unnamed protein product [Chrysoparadoxa australica]
MVGAGGAGASQAAAAGGGGGRSDPPSVPHMEGYLHKLKHKRGSLLSFGSWNKRYFAIDRETRQLEYFKSKEDCCEGNKPSGAICLNDISAAHKFDDRSFHVESPGRTFMLKADSRAQQAVWIEALQKYVAERKAYDRCFNSSY